MPAVAAANWWTKAGLVLIVLVGPLSLVSIVSRAIEGSADQAIRSLGSNPIYLGMFVYVMVMLPVARLAFARSETVARIRLVGYAVALAPVVAGLALTFIELIELVGG